MLYPIEKGQRQISTSIPIQTLCIGSGRISDETSQFLNESKLHIGNMKQYVENYMYEECKPCKEYKIE